MGQVARRRVLTGLAGLPLAAVLADARLARAAAGRLQHVGLLLSEGRQVRAALALPAETPAPAVLLVHEWWGLNDQIKTMAGELARAGYLALAVDLYDGKVASEAAAAQAYMQRVAPALAAEILVNWIAWLRDHDLAGGKVGIVGWCFGGGWSLNASILAPVDATVVYYGKVSRTAEQLAHLQGPVLGHFATEDQWITAEMVAGFEAEMMKAGKPYEAHWYEADHAFANPTGGAYDQEDAQAAWTRTLAFFQANLG